MKRRAMINTPLGPMRLTADEKGLQALDFRAKGKRIEPDVFFNPIEKSLLEYFEGKPLRKFPYGNLGGTAFQLKVWNALVEIPRGQTRSYSEVAKSIGSPRAARAVGSACGANPLPIFIPCHRVLAAGGKLGGYSGGLDIKRKLLKLESLSAQTKLQPQRRHKRQAG